MKSKVGAEDFGHKIVTVMTLQDEIDQVRKMWRNVALREEDKSGSRLRGSRYKAAFCHILTPMGGFQMG